MPIFSGSKIATISGATYIEQIQAGLSIMTRTHLTPACQPGGRKIAGCFAVITLAGRQLLCTSDQLIFCNQGKRFAPLGGWEQAKNLFPGDLLETPFGKQPVVDLRFWHGREEVWTLPAAECYAEGILIGQAPIAQLVVDYAGK